MRHLDFLETLDLERTNLPHQQQLHRIETSKRADRAINISKGNFLDALQSVEADYGLPRPDFSKLAEVLAQEDKRRARTTPFDMPSVPELPLTRAAARGEAPCPDYRQFLTESVRGRIERLIERLYAADFAAFRPYL